MKSEVRGRLILWPWAIIKVIRYLEIVDKAIKHGPNKVDPDPGSRIYPSQSDLSYTVEGLRLVSNHYCHYHHE